MKKFSTGLVVIAVLLASTPCFAGVARDRLETFTQGLESLRGTFVQRVHDAGGRVTESSRGTVALRAPRLFRWKYDDPFPQLIVADGDNVWVHDEDLEQVTVKNQSLEESQSPLTVLIENAPLERDYTVSEPPESDGLAWLKLVPKAKEASFETCELGFSDAGLTRMVLTDALGQRNELSFGKWERNPKLPPDTFRFTPPEGADLIGEPVKNADIYPIKN